MAAFFGMTILITMAQDFAIKKTLMNIIKCRPGLFLVLKLKNVYAMIITLIYDKFVMSKKTTFRAIYVSQGPPSTEKFLKIEEGKPYRRDYISFYILLSITLIPFSL